MKLISLLAMCICFYSGYSQFNNYVFNFGAGKFALWNDPKNWEGGVVPPSEVSKITIAPPDNSTGWECRLNVDSIFCYDTLRIKSNATFTILNEVTFRSFKNITIEKAAMLNVLGNCNVFCNYPGTNVIDNNGTVVVAGAVQNDPETLCLGVGFYGFKNNGPLYVYGTLNLRLANITCNNLLYVSGTITSNYRTTIAAQKRFVNRGSVSGNITVHVSDLENTGDIHLAGNDFLYSGLSLSGMLANYNSIYVQNSLALTGTVINKGQLSTGVACGVSFDSVIIVNDGSIYLDGVTGWASPVRRSSLLNNGSFSYFADPNSSYPPLVSNINLINHGTMSVNGWDMNKGSTINYKTINITVGMDSSRIRVPTINLGTINAYGPIILSDVFLNSGKLNTNPL